MTSVLIADDQALVRVGLRKILENEPETRSSAKPSTGKTPWRRRGGCGPTSC